MKLSPSMIRALELLEQHGRIFAGATPGMAPGSIARVSASTLRGLERRGWCTLGLGPDGGMLATITGAARAALATWRAAGTWPA